MAPPAVVSNLTLAASCVSVVPGLRLASDFLAPAVPQRCLTDTDREMRIAYLTLL